MSAKSQRVPGAMTIGVDMRRSKPLITFFWLFIALFATAAAAANMTTIMPDFDYEKTFSMAKPVVAIRAAFSESRDNCYHEPLAKLFVGPEAMKEERQKHLTGYPNGFGRQQVNAVVARHMLIDRFLHEAIFSSSPHRPRQVGILGAGFDTRAHSLGHLLAGGH
jgi:Leucine carboxyl methyltransferase